VPADDPLRELAKAIARVLADRSASKLKRDHTSHGAPSDAREAEDKLSKKT